MRNSFEVSSRPDLSLDLVVMTMADLEKVMQGEQRAYEIPWKRTSFEDCIKSKNQCLIVQLNNLPIGHCIVSYVLDEAHLLNICIDPGYKRQGYGRAVLSRLIDMAKGKGSAFFFLEVRESNAAAISLYHSVGFNEVGVRKGYYPAEKGRENAVLMTLDFRLV